MSIRTAPSRWFLLALLLGAPTSGFAQEPTQSPDASASVVDDDDSARADDDDSSGPTAPSEDGASGVSSNPQWSPQLTVEAPAFGSGLNLELAWNLPDGVAEPTGWAVLRSDSPEGPWEVRTEALTADARTFSDKLTDAPLSEPVLDSYSFIVLALPPGLSLAAADQPKEQKAAFLRANSFASAVVSGSPVASLFNYSIGYLLMALIILAVGVMIFYFTAQARAGKEIFIRRIPGIDAIEEGIGRATEMGKPVLYVPGIDELQDIQTIASMLILGEVAKKVAEYQSEIIVSCCIPIVREVAEEVVRSGFTQAGYADDYRSVNTRFISSEQFAFCAGTNGIILREKPATNIYFGRFFAESLILAETGFVNRSIQIAGTAEATQLPFFIAACDYTLIGEELFAVSAYLSRDPRLVSSLKASDWIKVFCVACLIVGTLLSSFGIDFMSTLFTTTGG
jgi:hypothetical protein